MNQKSLNAKSKAHKQILDHLKNKKIFKIFKKFENSISVNSNFAVAISGGPDSLSLAFLSRCFSLKNKLNLKFEYDILENNGIPKEKFDDDFFKLIGDILYHVIVVQTPDTEEMNESDNRENNTIESSIQ